MASNTTVNKEVKRKIKIFENDGGKRKDGTATLNGKTWQFQFGKEMEASEDLIKVLNSCQIISYQINDKGVKEEVYTPRFIVQAV